MILGQAAKDQAPHMGVFKWGTLGTLEICRDHQGIIKG